MTRIKLNCRVIQIHWLLSFASFLRYYIVYYFLCNITLNINKETAKWGKRKCNKLKVQKEFFSLLRQNFIFFHFHLWKYFQNSWFTWEINSILNSRTLNILFYQFHNMVFKNQVIERSLPIYCCWKRRVSIITYMYKTSLQTITEWVCSLF